MPPKLNQPTSGKTVKTAVPTNLLKPITEYITDNYKEYKIVGATKIVKGNETKYEVTIQKGTDVKTKERLIFRMQTVNSLKRNSSCKTANYY